MNTEIAKKAAEMLAPLLEELAAKITAEATRSAMQALLQRLAGDGWSIRVEYPTPTDPVIRAERDGIQKTLWVF